MVKVTVLRPTVGLDVQGNSVRLWKASCIISPRLPLCICRCGITDAVATCAAAPALFPRLLPPPLLQCSEPTMFTLVMVSYFGDVFLGDGGGRRAG